MMATTRLLAGDICIIFTMYQVLCSVKIMICFGKALILYAFYILHLSQNNTPVEANRRVTVDMEDGKPHPQGSWLHPPTPSHLPPPALHNSAAPVPAWGLQAWVSSCGAQWIRPLKLDSQKLVCKFQPSPPAIYSTSCSLIFSLVKWE